MRRTLIAIAGLMALIGTPVLAADMALKAPPAPTPAVSSWTGFYVGGTVGGAWGTSFQSFNGPIGGVPTAGTTGNYRTQGPVGGFTAGYNWQVNPAWVVGVETDIAAAGIKGTGQTNPSYNCGALCQSNVDMFGTVRGRVGLVAGSALFYGTGGYAYGREKANLNNLLTGSSTRNGWTGGGGIEYRFDQHWSAKAEYLYVKLDSFVWNSAANGTANCIGISCSTGNKFNVLRAGLNYKFN